MIAKHMYMRLESPVRLALCLALPSPTNTLADRVQISSSITSLKGGTLRNQEPKTFCIYDGQGITAL
jgi:hypothetical protein